MARRSFVWAFALDGYFVKTYKRTYDLAGEIRRKTSGTELSTNLGFLTMSAPLPAEILNNRQL